MLPSVYVVFILTLTKVGQIAADKTPVVSTEKNCSCGQIAPDIDHHRHYRERIVGGKEISERAHPFLALLLKNGHLLCGGSVINHQYVLTAAHCLPKGVRLQEFSVILGVHDRLLLDTGHEVTYSVVYAVVHEQYKTLKNEALNNDIALLRVDRKILFTEFIQPICLPAAGMETPTDALVMGWGDTSFQGLSSPVPLQASLTVLSAEECKNSSSAPILGDPQTHICALDRLLFADSCTGDSGGPLLVKINNYIVQIGIVSLGVSCGEGYPGIYTKVQAFIEWIHRHTANSTFCSWEKKKKLISRRLLH